MCFFIFVSMTFYNTFNFKDCFVFIILSFCRVPDASVCRSYRDAALVRWLPDQKCRCELNVAFVYGSVWYLNKLNVTFKPVLYKFSVLYRLLS